MEISSEWLIHCMSERSSTLQLVALMLFVVGCREPSPMNLPPSNLKADEDILFFPTYGRFDQDGCGWQFRVHGKVFEPEASSTKRAAFLAILRASADYSVGLDEHAILDDRVRPFLVDNERGKSVTVDIAGEQFLAGTSEANGHFSNTLSLPVESSATSQVGSRIVKVKAVLRDGDSRSFAGRIHLIAPHGLSVISDIDDTIKESQVTDKSALMRNTFLRKFRPVEGMPMLYDSLANAGVAFHYVSGSPWQLYQPIEAFMSDVGFPSGTYHLKHFRLKDSSALEILSSQKETKLAAIRPLLETFPERQFLLIGDSGEQDPEIYAQLTHEHPEQIIGIFIRNVTESNRDDERYAIAMRDVPDAHWTLFDDVSEITETVTSHLVSDR